MVIIAVIEGAGKNPGNKRTVPFAMLFQQNKDAAVVERFQVVADAHLRPGKTKGNSYGLAVLLCAVMVFSYRFQFQVEFPPPELPAGQEVVPENTYLIDNKDGTYTVIDILERYENKVIPANCLIDDMISQGFRVEKEEEK